MTTFQVQAQQSGSTAVGTRLVLKVLTGQAASPIGNAGGVAGITPSASITPAGNNSIIYAAILGVLGTFTPNAATTVIHDSPGQGLEYISCKNSGATSTGVAQTIGGTSTANGISVSLQEFLNGGSLAESATAPAPVDSTTITAQTALFTPPLGSLLVAIVEANGAAGVNGINMTDTSGLGLVWSLRSHQNNAGGGFSGIFSAPMPAPPVKKKGTMTLFDGVL